MGATASLAAMVGSSALSAYSSYATGKAQSSVLNSEASLQERQADLEQSQADAISARGIYLKSVADANAQISGLQATQTLEKGDIAAGARSLAGKWQVGEERAAQGASGLDVGSGSAVLTRIGTNFASQMDQITIRNNAARAAWGYQTQSMLDTYQGKFAKAGADTEAAQTRAAADITRAGADVTRQKADMTLLSGGLGAVSGPLSIVSSYLQFSRYSGGGGSGGGAPFPSGSSTGASNSASAWFPGMEDAA